MKNNQAQNIVEYILLVVAVILVFLVVLNPRSGLLKKSVEKTLNGSVDQIGNITNEIQFK